MSTKQVRAKIQKRVSRWSKQALEPYVVLNGANGNVYRVKAANRDHAIDIVRLGRAKPIQTVKGEAFQFVAGHWKSRKAKAA